MGMGDLQVVHAVGNVLVGNSETLESWRYLASGPLPEAPLVAKLNSN